ncbi:hypothetical protein DPMN_049373 [Dreissena polymorpha]|uniref:DUF6589 domain-containing protein n=1 Tax=Dreissena polymorpha TaxID=45954 RepID=A0A9D4HKE7_DREPO|nr:hypothetical protein DPMN_049373 [Dreissena polymorpha]
MRVLEGAYVNVKGGKGQNVESGLTQEHSVCNQKTLIKSLGANKSEKSIQRVTGAADTISEICSKLDECVNIKPKSGHHSKPLNESDKESVAKILRNIKPFKYTPGRKCPGFKNIKPFPMNEDQLPMMKDRLNQIITRLKRELHVPVEQEDSDSEDDI